MKTTADGKQYITLGKNAKPDIYNPPKKALEIIMDVLNMGMLMMNLQLEEEVQNAIL